jgi:purine operon repressor
MEGVASVEQKMLAVDCLKAMKEAMTFRELSKETKISAGILNRYLNGRILPKDKRAKEILSVFYENYLQQIVAKESRMKESKYIVTTGILSQPFLLKIIAFRIKSYFPKNINKILTAAVDGIPLAVLTAELYGAKSVYAKKTQELTFSSYYTSKKEEHKPLISPFYLPKDMLKRNDDVLIMDDVVRGGSTMTALLNICEQAKANILGIYAIFITKTAYRNLSKKFPVKYLFLIND